MEPTCRRESKKWASGSTDADTNEHRDSRICADSQAEITQARKLFAQDA
jgi:hypothetical protein